MKPINKIKRRIDMCHICRAAKILKEAKQRKHEEENPEEYE